MIPQSISKIIETLETTKLRFYDGYLKDPEDWRYCANGALIIESGFKPRELQGELYTLDDLVNYDDILLRLKYKYGIEMNKQYEKGFYCPFQCDELGHCSIYLKNLEQVLNHINDEHNFKRQHKETARILRVLSELFNLETGERLIAKVQ